MVLMLYQYWHFAFALCINFQFQWCYLYFLICSIIYLFMCRSAVQGSVAAQPVAVTNPFGTLPAMPQMSIGRAGTSSSIQYGISSMPVRLPWMPVSLICYTLSNLLTLFNSFGYQVAEKSAPVRISSLLTSRHLSQRRIRLPARKYNPKKDGVKVNVLFWKLNKNGGMKVTSSLLTSLHFMQNHIFILNAGSFF